MVESAIDTTVDRRRLLLEFFLFFAVAPLVIAVALPPNWMFPLLFAFTGLGIILLAITPGFRWRELFAGLMRISTFVLLLVIAGSAISGYLILQEVRPGALFFLLRQNPELMMMIAIGYPLVSALPQELVFRVLFFRRYGAILPRSRVVQLMLNAGVFSYAHLMYWSWIVQALTFFGGLAFAYSYHVRRNFPEAVLTHSIAGVIMFALGMGIFFYSGNVTRPF